MIKLMKLIFLLLLTYVNSFTNNVLLKRLTLNHNRIQTNNKLILYSQDSDDEYDIDYNEINNFKCFGNTDFSNKDFHNKKLITISPGGIQGFYMLGVVKFLCNEYNINKNDSYIYSGASAGSWLSVVLCLKGDVNKFIEDMLNLNFSKADSILQWELIIRDYILNYYRITDFDFSKSFISVTRLSIFDDIRVFKLKNDIYSDFTSLLDVLECCITSSHIPFVTGGLFNTYKNKFGYDGGFLSDPYIKNVTKILQIKPNMFDNTDVEYNKVNSIDVQGMLNKDDVNIKKLFKKGYDEAKQNKIYLDKIFL